MRTFLKRVATCAAFLTVACGPAQTPSTTSSPSADADDSPAAIHDRLFTLDTHVDIGEDLASASNDPGGFTANQVDLPKMRAGGLDAAFFILYSSQGPLTEEGYARARGVIENKYEGITRMAAAYSDQIAIATTSAEARAAAADGKLVAFIGMENAYPLGESVADVPAWAARGVRYVGIAHFGHNQFADSANPNFALSPELSLYDGLSPLGEQLVAALNRAGVMVDVSHAARTTMMDAIASSRAPIIASHSGVSGVLDNPRNLDDEQLRAIAENGGVAQIVAYASYVKAPPAERTAAVDALRERLGLRTSAEFEVMSAETRAAYAAGTAAIDAQWPRANVSDFVDHIVYAVEAAGIDHVGIASDFDGGGGIDGWADASETEAVTAELLRRGYTEQQLAKLWGGNLLRVLDEVQDIGREIRGE